MYEDRQSIKVFERIHARDRLAEEARHIHEADDARLLGPHLAGERIAQYLMIVVALAVVTALLGLAWLAI